MYNKEGTCIIHNLTKISCFIYQEAEEKRKKDEELEKQKQLDESTNEDSDSKLSKVLDRLDTLEGVVKEIVDGKRKVPSDLHTKEEVLKKDEASPSKASDLKGSASDTQPATVKSKDTNRAPNAPANTAQPNSKGNQDRASPTESKS